MNCKRAIFLCLVLNVVLILSACGAKSSVPIDEFAWDQVSTYSIAVNSNEERSTVTLKAPDYAAIMADILMNDPEIDLTSDILEEAIKASPDRVKEYTFASEGEDEESVRQAFLDQVAYEIMISGMSNMESSYIEQWEVE